MSLSPETTNNWISKLPPCSFLSFQFARGLGDWEALWHGDPPPAEAGIMVLESGCSPLSHPAGRPSPGSLAGPDGAVCNK